VAYAFAGPAATCLFWTIKTIAPWWLPRCTDYETLPPRWLASPKAGWPLVGHGQRSSRLLAVCPRGAHAASDGLIWPRGGSASMTFPQWPPTRQAARRPRSAHALPDKKTLRAAYSAALAPQAVRVDRPRPVDRHRGRDGAEGIFSKNVNSAEQSGACRVGSRSATRQHRCAAGAEWRLERRSRSPRQ
jgi:hypothetical protein